MGRMQPYDPLEERRSRAEAIKAARAAGESFRAIGKRFGISHERARQIIAAGEPGLAGWAGHSARNEADDADLPLDAREDRESESR
jgi:hypothetical protein